MSSLVGRFHNCYTAELSRSCCASQLYGSASFSFNTSGTRRIYVGEWQACQSTFPRALMAKFFLSKGPHIHILLQFCNDSTCSLAQAQCIILTSLTSTCPVHVHGAFHPPHSCGFCLCPLLSSNQIPSSTHGNLSPPPYFRCHDF